MSQILSEMIRGRCASTWQDAITHRLFRDITADTVDDTVFQRYLRIEFGFIDTAAMVLGYAVAKAPDLEARRHLSAALHGLTTDQVAFFIAAIGVAATPIRPQKAAGLHDHFLTVARTRPYMEIVACMLAAEWLYQTWCRAAQNTPSSRPHISAWVDLHVAPPFVAQVGWLRQQLDAYGTAAAPHDTDRLVEVFDNALAQEILFHDAAYEASDCRVS